MVKKIFQILKDIVYISKLTGVGKKKLIIFLSIFLSQLIAFLDISIILLFTFQLTGVFDNEDIFNSIGPILNFKFLLPTIILLRYFVQYYQNVLIKEFQLKIGNSLKEHIFEEIFQRKNFSVADSYFYINTLSGHVAFFYSSIATFFNYLLQTIAFSIFLFTTHPGDISIFMAAILALLYPIIYFVRKSRESMHQSYEASKSASYDIQRVVENLFLIKLLKKESDELQRYSNRIDDQKKYLVRNHKFTILNSFLPSLITVFILSILITLFNDSFNITLDFIAVTLRLFQALGLLTGSINQIANSHVHLEKFYELEESRSEINIENRIEEINNNNLIFDIQGIDFIYSNMSNYLFKNVALQIQENTHTLIVGPNGSGKSTFLGILAGIFHPTSGKLYAYRNKFAYVGPVPLIFTTTLKNNLIYGISNNIDDDELLYYIDKLNLFSKNRKINLDEIISNKSLSSGQMQKIAFIRALLAKPDVLFLDESTSNLDTNTKEIIFEILKKQKTTIVNSTHDPDSFKDVDCVVKIEIHDSGNKISFNN